MERMHRLTSLRANYTPKRCVFGKGNINETCFVEHIRNLGFAKALLERGAKPVSCISPHRIEAAASVVAKRNVRGVETK